MKIQMKITILSSGSVRMHGASDYTGKAARGEKTLSG